MTVADALKIILANSYAVYLKTKNFHWHVSGPYFRDYPLDELDAWDEKNKVQCRAPRDTAST